MEITHVTAVNGVIENDVINQINVLTGQIQY
jgi:hypothetical protein